MTKHVLTLWDLGKADLLKILTRAHELKQLRSSDRRLTTLEGKSIGVLLEKASTRTRVSFEVGIFELGAHPVILGADALQLKRGETLEDTGKVLSRYLDVIIFRSTHHARIEQLARGSTVPIINGLSDLSHPCQLLADLMTVQECIDAPLHSLKVAWIGDGNNMAHSWINAAALLGFELRVACPQGYAPSKDVVERAEKYGANLYIDADVSKAVHRADVVTTDVWTSMGQEDEQAARMTAFEKYAVTSELMKQASARAIFLHCLPAHRGEEVSAEVIDGSQSRVWDQAENRLHAQKALLEWVVTR